MPNEVYSDLNLYTTAEKFIIEPKESSQALTINRNTGEVKLEDVNLYLSAIGTGYGKFEFCGLLGSIQLLTGSYLVLATHREFVGYIANQAIWKLAGSKLIPYNITSTQNSNLEEENAIYLSMIETVLQTPFLYFSYGYDLTHTMQRLQNGGPSFLSQSFVKRSDPRFLWNGHLLKNFLNFGNFALPLIHGFISINNCVINGKAFTWSLVSRRSVNRAGTRLFTRGIDKEGNVANFVETEQIVEFNGDKACFVQIRGSIPLFWSQTPNLKYKPKPTSCDSINPEEHKMACSRHIDNLNIQYGRLLLFIDLIDSKGAEGNLKKQYANVMNGMKLAKYEPFDFHHECRHMRWDRLSILTDRLSHDQEEMSFFLLLKDGALIQTQDGVFRTNCIDCLDRTNVVQSMLGRRALTSMLRKLGIFTSNEQTVENQNSLESLFKNVWADNADLISIQYSGTGALKTDYTRTGKRTYAGALKDGINSLTRYYKNNFTDGFRQDALDLFLGYVSVNQNAPLLKKVERGWRYLTFPCVLIVAISMFTACSILPSEYSTESLLFLLFWGSMIFITSKAILMYGPEYVDKPRLTF